MREEKDRGEKRREDRGGELREMSERRWDEMTDDREPRLPACLGQSSSFPNLSSFLAPVPLTPSPGNGIPGPQISKSKGQKCLLSVVGNNVVRCKTNCC